MIFLANRVNLDKRTLLTRIHDHLQSEVPAEDSPVEQVWYHTSAGNKVGVRATINASRFLGTSYQVDEAELHVSFDFPPNHAYDFYEIQWVEADRDLMIGWHQDETHMDLGECHFQIDYRGETVQLEKAVFLDMHPLNVYDRRTDDPVDTLNELTWENGHPKIPEEAVL
jgi:hypothetical protein